MSSFTMIRTFFAMKLYEKLPRKMLLRIQEKKFRAIVTYAYRHSQFYRALYTRHGITEENLSTIRVEDLPTVDKDIIMENLDSVFTVCDVTKKELLDFIENSKNPNELFKKKYHVIHTSGSSGKIGVFVYSKNDWNRMYIYITNSFHFRLTKKKTVFYGATGGHYAGVSFSSWMKKGLSQLFCELLILDINEPIEKTIGRLNEFQPDILGGYFTGLKILAEQQERGVLCIHPTLLVNAGEGIIPSDKTFIEKVFAAPLVNNYGFAECIIAGVGRDDYGGILLREDLALIEIRDDHILMTNLYNRTQPLIRYRIDDYLKPKEKQDSKSPFMLVENVVGRAEFVIWFENDEGAMDFIHPLIFTDFYVKGLQGLQLVIKGKKSFDLRVLVTEKDTKGVIQEIKKKLDALLAEKQFTTVTYSIQVVDTLPVDKKTGKFKLIVKDE